MKKPNRSPAKKVRTRAIAAAAPEPTPAGNARVPVTVDLKESMKGALRSIGGSKADDWNGVVADQAVKTIWKSGNKAVDDERLNGVLSALICMSPKDEFEGMLIAQMIGTHNATMECQRRAMIPEQSFAGRQEALTQANKLSRTFATLLEALNRHRGKGQQKVTVEHVHVHAGGQAVVGVVEGVGGGGPAKLGNQPYALGHEGRAALRSEEQARAPVPIAGNA